MYTKKNWKLKKNIFRALHFCDCLNKFEKKNNTIEILSMVVDSNFEQKYCTIDSHSFIINIFSIICVNVFCIMYMYVEKKCTQ